MDSALWCRYKWPKQLCPLFLLFLYLSLSTHIVLFTSFTPWQHLLYALLEPELFFVLVMKWPFFIMNLKKNLVTFPLHTHYKSSSFSASHRLVLKWDKTLSWLKEIVDLLCPCAILFSSLFSVLMHRQSYVTVPIKVIIEGSLMKRGSTILTAKNLWFF